MLPIEHFIVAVLPLGGCILLRDRRLPRPRVTALIFVGSQFPDLVDKPLAHQFGLLPSGRVFMYSLPIAVPFLALVMYYGWRTERPRLTGVFAVAHLSHLLADNYEPLLDSPPTVARPPLTAHSPSRTVGSAPLDRGRRDPHPALGGLLRNRAHSLRVRYDHGHQSAVLHE